MKANQALKSVVLSMCMLLFSAGCLENIKMPDFPQEQNMLITDEASLNLKLVKKLLNQTVVLEDRIGLRASGIILDSKKGIVLTCHHCVEKNQSPWIVETYRGERFKVTPDMVEEYPEYDIAILTLGKNLRADSVKIRRTSVNVGERVIVIGTPFTLGHSLTVGYISAVNRNLEVEEQVYLYQTDAAINPGNSGGPWFDSNGYLIAMTNRTMLKGDCVSFGIPIKYLDKVWK